MKKSRIFAAGLMAMLAFAAAGCEKKTLYQRKRQEGFFLQQEVSDREKKRRALPKCFLTS